MFSDYRQTDIIEVCLFKIDHNKLKFTFFIEALKQSQTCLKFAETANLMRLKTLHLLQNNAKLTESCIVLPGKKGKYSLLYRERSPKPNCYESAKK